MSLIEKICLDQIIPRDAVVQEQAPGGCTVVLGASGGGVTLPQINNSSLRYLIGDVEVLEDHCAAMMFRCLSRGNRRSGCSSVLACCPALRPESVWT